MDFSLPFTKKTDSCSVHGASSNAANRTLIVMIAACFALIAWRVWTFGPSGHWAAGEVAGKSFLRLLWGELWDLAFSSHGIVAELRDIVPYYLVGLLLGGYLRTYKIAIKLQNSLRRYGIASVFLASLVGIITPLCACGTLTTAISLLFAGLPLAPVMSLLVTSPLLSPSAFLLTLNDLGPEWTVVRTVSAYAMGVMAGLTAHFLRNRGFKTKELFIEGAIIRGDFHDDDYPDERLRCNCREKFGNRVAVRTSNNFLIFLAKSAEMCWPVGKYVLVGVAIGSIVERYMPYQWVYRLFGSKDPLSIVWVTLGAVPLFLHQISASSILSHIKTTLHGTLDAGAALAFIIGGPVTAIPTLALFWSVFKKRVFVLYLVVCIVGTLLIAYSAKYLIFVPGVDIGNPLFSGVSRVSGGASAMIEKTGERVKIVLDVNDRKTIAVTDSDPINGHGAVVFDASLDRFREAARLDNLVYITNAARWLQESAAGTEQSILIYNTRSSSGFNIAGIEPIRVALQKEGFKVTITERGATGRLTAKSLEKYSQVWVLFGQDNGATRLKDEEINALCGVYTNGRGLMVIAGTGDGQGHDMTAVNDLTAKLGVKFSQFGQNLNEIKVANGARFFIESSAFLSRMLKIFHKA